ncbi:glycosyltransferase family 2 protein [Maritimibacter fusiformis]|uniref:Glycosyltransferase family 2 protein n=1 Tax=Maritimibacter fusiformis TaxID=2603819 RepID=A0A5D0RM19_9RHOB|nr:glycosyltransferase family 2 protein [Maritimibacter fusiformis]TYB81668.1 glycosyltransferase family 2 protein [Maritimibacter fusiformis]
MRIVVHIGLPHCGAEALQAVLNDKRGRLSQQGVLYSGALGRKNHTRLYMAVSDPGHVDPLRAARGFAAPPAQERLRRMVAQDLAAEVAREMPSVLLLSASQLATLPNRAELVRLRTLLSPISDDITILAHLDEQARVMLRHYADALENGRTAPLSREIEAAASPDWRKAALADWDRVAPALNDMPEIQAMPHWLDYAALTRLWGDVFGADKVVLRPYRPEVFHGAGVVDELREMLGLDASIGKAEPAAMPAAPSDETLARQRALNEIFTKLLAKSRVIPRPLWKRLMSEVAVPGDPIRPGRLSDLSKRFEAENRRLTKAHPSLGPATLKRDRALKNWQEPLPGGGFRATQYAAAFLPRIEAATRAAKEAPDEAAPTPTAKPARSNGHAVLTPSAEAILSDRAKENFHHLHGGRFAPHNRLGHVNEEELAAAFTEVPVRTLPEGRSGNVIVGCMKDEAPYILEWIAYHRMIGVDNFLIYTNGCSDGTDALLDRLQALGIVQHRDNDDWKGNSPQQHALNKSLKEPLIQNADWVIHIDVDEFINVRCGNGRLDDFFERVPDATNVAMTWRLFGHNGVTRFADDLVIDQFDMAAPKYCPKPHTAWGFKTMTKNTGAYEKLSCHRPNKLRDEHAPKVRWVNGSGLPMSEAYHEKGWRSDLKTIGYDLLQLNHYALRSAESFLIKRQRGRALHVDRSIGLNYWVRMDWSGNRDITIKRNIPRVRAELARLMADAEVARLHDAGVSWHRDKLRELHGVPEFEELYTQALATDLTELERVAFALALDMEN